MEETDWILCTAYQRPLEHWVDFHYRHAVHRPDRPRIRINALSSIGWISTILFVIPFVLLVMGIMYQRPLEHWVDFHGKMNAITSSLNGQLGINALSSIGWISTSHHGGTFRRPWRSINALSSIGWISTPIAPLMREAQRLYQRPLEHWVDFHQFIWKTNIQEIHTVSTPSRALGGFPQW